MLNPPLVTIRLYGVLGKKYGRTWRLAVKTPRAACRAIDRLRPGFARDVLAVKGAFRVRVGDRIINEKHVDFPVNGRTISITPLFAGAANKALAIGEAILGIVLVVVDIAFLHTGYLTSLGIGLALGGVAGLLSPVPSLDSNNNPNAHKPSYQFNGPVNTVAQGAVHPVAYGKPIVGSAVISAGIFSEDVTDSNTSGGGSGSGGGGGTGSGGSAIPLWIDEYVLKNQG